MKSPKELWEEYKTKVFRPESLPLPEDQERETSLAFYAGILTMVKVAADAPEDEEQQEIQMQEFMDELDEEAMRVNLDRI